MTRILIVEDDARLRATLSLQLKDAGYAAEQAESAEEARAKIAEHGLPDLLLVDVRLSGDSGVELIERLREEQFLPATIVMSGEATMEEAVRAIRLGVIDFIEKPFTRERLLRSIDLALELRGLRRQVERLGGDAAPAIIGASEAMIELERRIRKAAVSEAAVLIQGESGTGKELVADALHRSSPRAERPFVRLNCAAIPTHLVEDELFGHVKGAFTGAHAPKPGLFEVADGGTLFLDEIGDMELDLQSRLLRVLEDGRLRRLGDTRERRVDVRVLSATHRMLENGAGFRQDLFFRLAELRIEVPPLRDRGADIRLLFHHFLEHACQRQRTRPRRVTADLLAALERHPWPGNVRELKNVCNHLAVFGGETLEVADLPSSITADRGERERVRSGLLRLDGLPRGLSLKELKTGCEREYIEATLRRFDWNFSRAAEELGLARTYLHDRARKLGIRRPERRDEE